MDDTIRIPISRAVYLNSILKRTLLSARGECSKAQLAIDRTKIIFDQVKILSPKLQSLNSSIHSRLQDLRGSCESFNGTISILNSETDKYAEEYETQGEKIDTIFEELEMTEIPEELTKKKKIKQKTLVDFVDKQSLFSIRNETKNKLVDMRIKISEMATLLRDTQTSIVFISSLLDQQEEYAKMDNSDLNFIEEGSEYQKEVSSQMAEILLKTGSLFSLSSEMLHSSNTGQEFSQKDFNEIEENCRHVSDILSNLNRGVEEVADIEEQAEDLVQGLEHCVNIHIEIQQKLDQTIFDFEQNNKLFSDRKKEYSSRKAGVSNNLQEIESLIEYYSQFIQSFGQMIIENKRRADFIEKEKKMIQDLNKMISDQTAKENEERQAFWEQHGQYLPPSLASEIKELAPKRSVQLQTYQ